MVRGINHAKANEGKAWIVDSHRAKGVFSTEIQEYIASDVFPRFAEIGIKYFIPITAEDSVTRLTVNQYSSQAGPNGLQLLKGSSAVGAISWLKTNA